MHFVVATQCRRAMAMVMASASLMVKKKNWWIFFLVYCRLVGIVDPQWHFDSTLANRLAL